MSVIKQPEPINTLLPIVTDVVALIVLPEIPTLLPIATCCNVKHTRLDQTDAFACNLIETRKMMTNHQCSTFTFRIKFK